MARWSPRTHHRPSQTIRVGGGSSSRSGGSSGGGAGAEEIKKRAKGELPPLTEEEREAAKAAARARVVGVEEETPIGVQREEFVRSLMERQGKTVRDTKEGQLVTDGKTQTLISTQGEIITAPTSATLRGRYTKQRPTEIVLSGLEEREQVRRRFGLIEEPEREKPRGFGATDIKEATFAERGIRRNLEIPVELFETKVAKRRQEFAEFGSYFRQQQRIDKLTTKERFVNVAAVTGTGMLGVTYGAVSVFARPVQTVKDVYRLVTQPITVGKELGAALEYDPIFTSGSVAGSVATFKVGGKVGSRIITKTGPKVKSTITEFIKDEGTVPRVVPARAFKQFEVRTTGKAYVPIKQTYGVNLAQFAERGVSSTYRLRPVYRANVIEMEPRPVGLTVIEKRTGAIISETQTQIYPKAYDVTAEFKAPTASQRYIPRSYDDYLGKWLPRPIQAGVTRPTYTTITTPKGRIDIVQVGRAGRIIVPERQLSLVADRAMYQRSFAQSMREATRTGLSPPIRERVPKIFRFKRAEIGGRGIVIERPRSEFTSEYFSDFYDTGTSIRLPKSRFLEPRYKMDTRIRPALELELGTLALSKTMQISIGKVLSMRSRAKLKPSLAYAIATAQTSFMDTKTDVRLRTMVAQDVAQLSDTRTVQRQDTIFKFPTDYPPYRPISPPRRPPPRRPPKPPRKPPKIPPPIIFNLGFWPTTDRKKKRKKTKYFREYTPSLEAVGEKVYGRQPRVLTGIGLRPIIIRGVKL